MSLIDELKTNGVTAEDLEKAASARLFQAACAENEVDLTKLSEEKAEELYADWLKIQAGGGEPEKTAEAEQTEIRKEAAAKCAEVEYLGRYMAQCFLNEMQKGAAMPEGLKHLQKKDEKDDKKDDKDKKKEAGVPTKGLGLRKYYEAGMKAKPAVAAAGATGVLAGTAAGRASKGSEKKSDTPMLDEMTLGYVQQILEANNIDSDAFAAQLEKGAVAEPEKKADEAQPTIDDVAYARAVEWIEAQGLKFQPAE